MRFVILGFALIIFSGCTTTHSLSDTKQSQCKHLFRLWHSVSNEEYDMNYEEICHTVDSVLILSDTLSGNMSEWYRGMGYFSKARAEARLHRNEDARRDVLNALDHRLRNDALIRTDTVLLAAIGRVWFDSVVVIWTKKQQELRKHWPLQIPLVSYPSQRSYSKRYPVIIALHGGNGSYEEFASHFSTIPDSLDVIMAFPPGNERVSKITNSWSSNTIATDSLVLALRDSLKVLPDVDSTQMYLVGYSQGASVAIHLAMSHPNFFLGTIIFSGFALGSYADSVLENVHSHHTRFFAISGARSENNFQGSVKKLQIKCSDLGIPFQYEIHRGMLHEVPIDLENIMIAAWKSVKKPIE